MTRSWRRLIVASLGCLVILAQVPTAQGEHGGPALTVGDTDDVIHRYVWDEYIPGRRGLHLRSASPDGSDVRSVYDSPRGWTSHLTMDRSGHRVAFSPCCRTELPAIVVVNITNGMVSEPLADHPEIDAVGGIGWSPDGRRIAFEGFSGQYPHRHGRIWTIRPDGAGLRRVLHLFNTADDSKFYANDALAWTSEGILYSDGDDLRVARRGESRVVLPRVWTVRISGDGLHIVTTRFRRDRPRSVWIGDPDGTDQRRLFFNEPGTGAWYADVTPNYDGQLLSAIRESPDPSGEGDRYEVVTWGVDESPRSATVMNRTEDIYVFSWN